MTTSQEGEQDRHVHIHAARPSVSAPSSWEASRAVSTRHTEAGWFSAWCRQQTFLPCRLIPSPQLQQRAKVCRHLRLLQVQAVQLCQLSLGVPRVEQRGAAEAVLVQRPPYLHVRPAGRACGNGRHQHTPEQAYLSEAVVKDAGRPAGKPAAIRAPLEQLAVSCPGDATRLGKQAG